MAVILWGAFVRASGSGAGCGAHWPLCNGTIIPPSQRLATIIEFAHRISSGLSLLFVFAVFFGTRKFFPAGFQRKAALAALVAIILEALIGAVIVLLRLVEHDKSMDRVVSISLHLLNTLFLLGSLTVLALACEEKNPRWKIPGKSSLPLILGFGVLGALGAMAALGDTLFPVTNLSAELLHQNNEKRHFLENIRVFHPLLAVLWAGYVWLWLADVWVKVPSLKKASLAFLSLVAFQILVGLGNVLLLAPVWGQIFHLFMANMVWIFLVFLVFSAASRWQSPANSGMP